jgi:hypothetical protein
MALIVRGRWQGVGCGLDGRVRGENMKRLLPHWMVCLASAAFLATGCTTPIPMNSPRQCIAHDRPVVQPATQVLPPAAMLQHPGPGVGGPGPGVLGPDYPNLMYPVAAPEASQIGFRGNDGMKIYWDVGGPGLFDSEPLIEPAKYNFPEGAIYRLKLTNLPGRPGVELYPTIEVALATPRTEAFLAHNFIPFELTAEDFEQVLSGNFVTKVIYLPDAEHQDVVLAGAETLVSTRLEPGKDPIVEAEKRGSIMAIIRLGNKDLQAPGAEMAGAPNGVFQASFHHRMDGDGGAGCGPEGCGPAGCGPQGCGPGGYGMGYGGGNGYGCGPGGCGPAVSLPPGYVAGVTAPMYGMPMCGTPIGLAGPPHIPLGVPAGLQEHSITNYTHYSIPEPVHNVEIKVAEVPGLSYPKPPHKAIIIEATPTPPVQLHQPAVDRHQEAPGYDATCQPQR